MTAPFRSTDDPLALAALAASDGLYAYDLTTGAFSWREGASRRFGLSDPECTGLDWWKSVVHPEDVERLIQVWESAVRLRSSHWSTEFRLKRADGTWAYVTDCGGVWIDAEGRAIGVHGGVRDVSERRWAEDVLAQSEERYRKLVELSPDSVVVHSEGRVLYVNNQALKLLGAEQASDLIGISVIDRVHPDYRDAVKNRIRAMSELGEIAPLAEEVLLRLDGTPVETEIAASRITFLGKPAIQTIIRDVSARKRAETALEDAYAELRRHAEHVESESEQRARELATQRDMVARLVEFAPAGLGFIDKDLVFRWMNPMLAQFLQVGADRLVGKPLFEVIPEVEPQFGPILKGVLETGTPFRAIAAPFVYEVDGQTRTTYWDYTYMPVFGQDNEVEGLLVLNHEVSDRVAQEKVLQEQIEKLQELDRLKVSFVNTVSHELRTPLTSIKGYAEFLEDEIGGTLSDEQMNFVGQILFGADKLRRLVDDLLDFARLEAGTFQLQRQDADLTQLVRQEVAILEPQLRERQLVLELVVPEEPMSVHMDAPRLGQVVLNIVGNAIKFTHPGGRVAVRLTQTGDAARIEVKDSGIGIPEAHLPLLFQKFYQVDPSVTREFGGAGLGLSIAKALIEAHGGAIGVESTPGDGSTFWFTVPIRRS